MWTAEDVKKARQGSGKWTADMVKNIRAGNKVNINDPINQLSPLERDRAEQARRSKMGTTKNMTPEVKTSVAPKSTANNVLGLGIIAPRPEVLETGKKGLDEAAKIAKGAVSALSEGSINALGNISHFGNVLEEKNPLSLGKALGMKTYADQTERAEQAKYYDNLASGIRSDLGVDPNAMSKTGNFIYNTAINIPSMLAGPAIFGASAAGGYAKEAEEKGATTGQALAHGLVGGGIELGLEQALGAIPGIKNLKNITKGGIKGFIKTTAGEVLEEAITDPLTKLSEKAVFNKKLPWYSNTEDAVINPINMGMSGLGGLTMTAMLAPFGLGGNVQQQTQQTQQQTQQTPIQAEQQTRPMPIPKKPDFYTDTYGNTATDINASRQMPQAPLMLPAPIQAEQQAETKHAQARQRVQETTFTPDEKAQIDQILAEDEVYQELAKDLEGVNIESDIEVQNLAKRIKDKSGAAYNMTDVYRNISRQDPTFAQHVKENYLDPLDADKGKFAQGTVNSIKQMANILKKYGIKNHTIENKALVWYREGQRMVGSDKGFFGRLMMKDKYDTVKNESGREIKIPKMEKYTLEDLKREFPNKWKNIVEADKELKPIFDNYFTRINETLKQIYPYVEQELEPWQKALDDLELGKRELSPEAYASSKAEILAKMNNIKKGKRLEYRQNYYHHYRDVMEGFGGLANIFDAPGNIDPTLAGISEFTQPKTKWAGWMQRRGLGKYEDSAIGSMLKYIPSAEYAININPHIAKFRNLAKNIAEGTAKTRNANNMVQYLTDYANDLAGKTNNTFLDRFLTRNSDSKRIVPRLLKWINNRVKGNVVLGKFSSAINQILNVPNGIARIKNPIALTKAIGQTIAGNSAIEQSGFMAERYMDDIIDQFDTKLIQQPKRFAKWLLTVGDKLGTTFIWNGAYNKAVQEKQANPIKYADELTRSVVAGRGVGEVPLWQKASTFQMIAPFQLEVANVWHVIKDMANEKDVAGIIILMLANYMFNNVLEGITGNRGSLDLIGAAEDALLEDDIYTSIKEGFEFKDTNALEVAGRIGGEILSNVPIGQSAAALVPENPTTLNYGAGEVTIPSRSQLFGDNDPTRFGSAPLIVKGLQDPLYKLAMPWGGDQLKRSIEGIKAYNEGFSRSKTGRIRYPIEPTPLNALRVGLFGQYSTPEAREYFDKNRTTLSPNQTQQVMSSDDPQQAYLQVMQQRQINSLNQKIKDIAADDTLSRAEKDKKINEIRQKINELRAAQ